MVRCPRCGYDNDLSDIYCRNCTYPLQDPKTNFKTKKQRDKSWNMGTGKKILLIVGIIVIAFLLFSIIYNVTQPSPQSSLNVVTGLDKGYENSYTPFKVNISSGGNWYAEIGQQEKPQTISGTGNKILNLENPSWENITVKVTKIGSNPEPLSVQLIKNGKVIAEDTTNITDDTIILKN